ncbi:hypothetical protein ISR92_00175 [Patescibacteria group bacterium]|nr:hypothetical protein [Patescibacteria group bacterium]
MNLNNGGVIMLQLVGTDPFFMSIDEFDEVAMKGLDSFQSGLLKLAGFVPIHELDQGSQDGWNLFQSALRKSASSLPNFSIDGRMAERHTVRFSELFNDRPLGITLEQQQSAVAELMICLDPKIALQITQG